MKKGLLFLPAYMLVLASIQGEETGGLKVDQISTSGPGDILVWQQTPNQKLAITVHNLAQVPAHYHYRVQITGYDDKVRLVQDGKLDLDGGAAQPLTWPADPSAWPLGPYDGDFSVYDDSNKVVLERPFRMGVIDLATLDKARSGEFLYGLDSANSGIFPVHTPTAFAYYRLMGVDILRNTLEKGMSPTVANVGIALSQLAPEKVQSTLMCDPPRGNDPLRIAQEQKEKDAYLEECERLYGGSGPGKIRYFELGNEPDLPGFYPGSTTDYVKSYEEMLDSIKSGAKTAGLKDSDSVVTTGGLSFAGQIGPIRSDEILKKLNPAKIDAIAYHGHGPGIGAERNAYERVHAVTVKYQIENHPFIETESGYSGQEHRGMERQAYTAIEKLTYAQSQHEPLLIFFRLFMEGEASGVEGGYGMTHNFVEPHPSIFAYRNLVERLRHQSYDQTLDIAGKEGFQGVDGFLFSEHQADGSLTGRKTTVLFAENPSHSNVRLRLDSATAKVDAVTLYDMYGNPSPLTLGSGNIALVPVGVNPVFLAWNSSGTSSQVDVVPPLFSLAENEPLLINADNTVKVVVHNTESAPLQTTVSLSVATRVPNQTSPPSVTLTVPPGQTATAPFQVKLQTCSQPLSLPIWWKVFTGVDITKIDPTQLTALPDSLPSATGPVTGQFVWATGNRIDFGKLSKGLAEKRAGFAFAYVDATEDTTLPCAASADWYMAWYANGTKVYDTLQVGNRGGSLADHTFDLPLKKGRNVIVAEVLSGSQGWTLLFGGPKERQVAVSTGNDPDHLSITSTSNTESLVVPVSLEATLPKLDSAAKLDDFATWQPLEPLTVLNETAAKNLWMKEPDSSKWYGGPTDLSGTVWLRDTGANLELYLAVTDDKHIEAPSPQDLDKGDAVRIVLSSDDGKVLLDATGGLVSGQPVLKAPNSSLTFKASAPSPGQPETLYRWEIPKSLTGATPFRLNVSILDNDSTFLKQTLDLGDVNNPSAGTRVQTGE